MHGAECLAPGRQANLAGLHRQVDLCEQLTAGEVPDAHGTIVVGDGDPAAGWVDRNLRRDARHCELRDDSLLLE